MRGEDGVPEGDEHAPGNRPRQPPLTKKPLLDTDGSPLGFQVVVGETLLNFEAES